MILRIYNFLRNFLIILFLSISIYASNFYEGSNLIFITYSFSLIFMIYYLTNKFSTFFEIFFSCYIFLGFWFKYIFSLIFFDGNVYDSGEYKSSNIDDILLVGIIIINTINISSWISRRLINRNVNFNKINTNSIFQKIYLKNRLKILFTFLLIVCLVSLINIEYNIYQRGFISLVNINLIFLSLIKWLLLFGLTTFSCFLIHTEITKNNNISFLTFIIATLEIFLSYSSMLSRSFIINTSSIFLPSILSISKNKNSNRFFIYIFTIIIILTVISVFFVNSLRLDKLNKIKAEWKLQNLDNTSLENKNKEIEQYQFEITNQKKIKDISSNQNVSSFDMLQFIIVNRWIGIDSLILVHNYKKNNFNLLVEAFKEVKSDTENTFYEKTFGLSKNKINIQTSKLSLKGNTLPGIISFLYYSGNIYFLAIILFFIIFIFNYFEKIIRLQTNNNLIFTCFVSQMLSTRLIHFGYAPKDSYLFLISIFMSILFMVFLSRFHLDLFKNKNM